MRKTTLLLLTLLLAPMASAEPVRIGVAGLTHTHVHWIFESAKERDDFVIVGIAEANRDLAERYAAQHGFSMDLVHPTLEAMLEATSPDGVTAFGTIREHLEVVEVAAPRGVHVMVEKPLAISNEHAQAMATLAREHGIELLTNYETTWYPSNHFVHDVLTSGRIGEARKIVVHDGHKGPTKLGINREFLDWLTDSEENGGGALPDFGCYGANLATWLLDGRRPRTVTAVTQQFQPENNPKVEDEATVILTYPSTQVIIQASWNWPFSRKDIEVYGLTGTVHADDRQRVRLRESEEHPESLQQLPDRLPPHDDPFSLFAAVIRGEVTLDEADPSALENNLVVVEILDAARRSAAEGRTISLD
ncbi:MAG: Gfo/Idh/MocA family oxidoreductase [Pseudomonadota bacterium]